MSITPRRVHNEHTGVLADSLRERFRAVFHDDVAPADFAREGGVGGGSVGVRAVDKLGDDDLFPEARFSLLTFDRGTVDREVSEVAEELLSTVLALNELEQLRSVVNELRHNRPSTTAVSIESYSSTYSSPGLATNEDIVGQEAEQERNVCLTDYWLM